VKNDSDKTIKKDKKINKIKDQLALLRAKLKASEDQQTSFSSKPKFKKIKAETGQAKNKNLEARAEKKESKETEKKKAKETKKKEKEEKKKQARIRAEAKKKEEEEAKKQGVAYGKGNFPWAASGRSLSLGRSEGMTKVLFEEDTKRVIGVGIVGPNAGDLIAEGALAIEMGCDAEDLSSTIHPHPTLSETVAFAAEAFQGTITDLYLPKKKKNSTS